MLPLVVFVLAPFWLLPLWEKAYLALDRIQPFPIRFG